MIIGISGGGVCSKETWELAYQTGKEIALRGHMLVNGGLYGVMEASAQGARENGGITVGILPGSDKSAANKHTLIPITTDMGESRNIILMQTADAVIAFKGEFGTLSEVAIALKIGKKVVSLESWDLAGVIKASNPSDAVNLACAI